MTLFSSLAYAQENPPTWTAPCFEGPCEYTYEDADRSIVIQKITGDQSAGLLIDVQLREVAGFRAGAAAGDFEALSSMAQPLQRRTECGAGAGDGLRRTGRRDFAAGPGISKFL